MRTMRIALAQINPTVGDLQGNRNKILEHIAEARSRGADLVAFPELSVCGYPPEDLVFKQSFLQDNKRIIEEIAARTKDITAVVGFVDTGKDAYNAAAILHNGKQVGVYHKLFLPTYSVFDEDRYFKRGDSCSVFTINGVNIGVNICEDIWYELGPTTLQRDANAEVIVNINGSPYYAGKREVREKFVATRAIDNQLFVAYVNQVGGQDELVFDGASMIFDYDGHMLARGKQFQEDMLIADLDLDALTTTRMHNPRPRKQWIGVDMGDITAPNIVVSERYSEKTREPLPKPENGLHKPLPAKAEVYKALVMGLGDYIHKSGFKKAVLGLSGGIDSSICATLLVDAIGKENVIGIAMPSRFNSNDSLDDARILAQNLDIEFQVVSIEEPFEAFLKIMKAPFKGTEPNVAEENLQARIRGNILMGIANKFNYIVITTSNKSESATGYTTLYGDMAGGFAVIKDVPKMLVYDLCHYRNTIEPKDCIPERVFTKAPTAELRFNQTDQDTLPPYAQLDQILEAYVENDRSLQDIVAMGFPEATVKRVMQMVDRNEYKRRQAAPGVKITPRSFGKDRRLPIVNKYIG
ncbi:MAG: NAD+ synthase [Dehalococcoidia bacterium]|nr:NAD+ synthase [Dehalococcoidia bacterium]